MRLACPNCDAKYEVPDDAIPEAGRDVQCSNCGHAWFQLRPEQEVAAEDEAALYGDDLPVGDDAEPGVAAVAAVAAPVAPPPPLPDEPDTTAAAVAALMAGSDPVAAVPPPPPRRPAPPGDEDFEDDDPPSVVPMSAAPPLDDSVLSVLREEAEREAEARRAEAQRAEARRVEAENQAQTQTDPVAAAPVEAPAITPTQRRLAMLRGEDPDAPPPEPAKPAARRDLLPDVEEINSTLQPGENLPDPDAMVDALPDLTRARFSFRTGFLLTIFLLAVAAVVYVAAPSIAEMIPAMREPLAGYVAFVDGLRIWLDGLMNAATEALSFTSDG